MYIYDRFIPEWYLIELAHKIETDLLVHRVVSLDESTHYTYILECKGMWIMDYNTEENVLVLIDHNNETVELHSNLISSIEIFLVSYKNIDGEVIVTREDSFGVESLEDMERR